jgi:predicted small secreted protein
LRAALQTFKKNKIKHPMKRPHYSFLFIAIATILLGCNNNSGTGGNNDTTAGQKLKEVGNDIKNAATSTANDIRNATDTAVANAKRYAEGNADSNFVVKASCSRRALSSAQARR